MEESRVHLDNLGYFVEWGGRNWEQLLRHALVDHIGTDLRGMRVLEVGCRSGKMASLFALLGAEVTGVEVRLGSVRNARREAEAWGVGGRTVFIYYDGDLDAIRDRSFDLIFTKSVLVMLPNLEAFLPKLKEKLKPGAKCLFLENGCGPWPVRAWRFLLGSRWKAGITARYFTPRELELLSRYFSIEEVRRTSVPPVYSIVGRRRE